LTTIPGGGNGAYSASKHGVVGLSETLRVELDDAAPEIGVTVLCPGPVPSRIHDSSRNRPAALADSGPVAVPSQTTTMTPLTPVEPAGVGGAGALAAGRAGGRGGAGRPGDRGEPDVPRHRPRRRRAGQGPAGPGPAGPLGRSR